MWDFQDICVAEIVSKLKGIISYKQQPLQVCKRQSMSNQRIQMEMPKLADEERCWDKTNSNFYKVRKQSEYKCRIWERRVNKDYHIPSFSRI